MLCEEKMNAVGHSGGKSVPPEAMRDVEGKMGFDKMGMPGEHRGPPEGMGNPPMMPPMGMPQGPMGQPAMYPAAPPLGMDQNLHIPPHFKDLVLRCFEEGGTKEECRERLSKAMLDEVMRCDAETGGDFEKCSGGLRQQFNVPEDAFPPFEEDWEE